MEYRAIYKTARTSPYKARLIANVIRGYSYPEAVDILRTIPKKTSDIIMKTLHSAGANAKYSNPEIKDNQLFIKKITVDGGVVLKRFSARARGRGTRILKRTAHITVVLSDEN
jgi:large subunit ribosomal protein L22